MKRRARENLPANLNIVFSIAEYDNRAAFREISGALGAHDGVSIDFDNDPNKVQDFFVGQGVNNFWYGNGIFVAGVGPNVERSVAEGARLRDAQRKIKKVYVWTLASENSIETYFNTHKIDGVFVNPGTLGAAARIAGRFGRVAVRSDPAFQIWEAAAAPVVSNTPGARVETTSWYRLTNSFLGAGRSLDTYSTDRNDPFMGQTGNFSGQYLEADGPRRRLLSPNQSIPR